MIEDENILMMHQLKMINIGVGWVLNSRSTDMELTAAQCSVMGYLSDHRRDGDICAADLHRSMRISRASISATLKKLREKGFIAYQADEKDDRMRYIVMTDKAIAIDQKIQENLRFTERILTEDFTQAEKKQCVSYLDRMLNNLRQYEDRQKEG